MTIFKVNFPNGGKALDHQVSSRRRSLAPIRMGFQPGVGWIFWTLQGGGARAQVSMSAVYDPLPEFVDWLEACLEPAGTTSLLINEEAEDKWLVMQPGAVSEEGLFQVQGPYPKVVLLEVKVDRTEFVSKVVFRMGRFFSRRMDWETWARFSSPKFVQIEDRPAGECSVKELGKSYLEWVLQRFSEIHRNIG